MKQDVRLATLVVAVGMIFALTVGASAQSAPRTPNSPAPDGPEANPGRPTISTPATLTDPGYFQFETGFLSAWTSPEFSSQTNLNEVVKFAVSKRFEFLVGGEPVARSTVMGGSETNAGGVVVGLQSVVYHGEGARPTIALGYFRSFYGGDAPDLDMGSYRNSALVLASADIKKFHFDFNLFLNEQVEAAIHRGQFGQSLSISHPLPGKFGLSGEIWHFTQPFLRANAVGNLWAVSYSASRVLVFDGGFERGLTSTSTRWELFGGFTYLLPYKIPNPLK
jgi:hypothetical protein